MDKELLEKIENKLKETKSIRNLNSKDFRFKNWHASTINLLKTLPPYFIQDINDFKKLTFIDTKYHRGNRFLNPAYDPRYLKDLDLASTILKKIVSTKKETQPEKETIAKKEKTETVKVSKPKKPSVKAKTGKNISKPKKSSSSKPKNP